MINLRKKGFTLIELLAVIVLLAVIALIGTPIILGIIDDTKMSAFKDSAYGISQAAKNAFVQIMYSGANPEDIIYLYTDSTETSSPSGYRLNYEGERPKNGQVSLKLDGKVALVLHDGKYCATKGYDDAEITLEELTWTDCEDKISTVINAVIVAQYDELKGVNRPKLATGMTPIKWNGTAWVDTTSSDNDWYDYTTTNKKWANAKTSDGSMWVWIPRYAYQIATNYHSNTAGTINIKFLKETTNIATDDSVVDTIPTYSGTSQTNYIKHPAFAFGDTEVTGIWVAKFEASGTENAVEFKPNATSFRGISINDMFTYTRNMETNDRYGWGTSGNGIDTHMMKNGEWGSVAYLSQSTYGINSDIGINNNSNFLTGCGAPSGTASSTTCNTYDTTNGMLASTTGNIYGIYDMSGGSHEYVAAYINNGNSNLSNGSNIINANAKYKDVYTVTNDDEGSNYINTVSKFGDGLYEVSIWGTGTWYNDATSIPSTTNPWFVRGMKDTYGQNAGVFGCGYNMGNVSTYFTFRTTLIVTSEPPTIAMTGNDLIDIQVGAAYTDAGATATDEKDGSLTSNITTTGTVDTNVMGKYIITYSVTDSDGNTVLVRRIVNVLSSFDATEGVNRPVLAAGMTPIKWNGSAWIDTTESDTDWYNYTTTDKKWANAKTSDGSMWVWIPRYAYQVATNYHTYTAGTINIKFLKGTTNTAADNSTVDTAATYSGSAQTNYIKHSAFTFGSTEMTGIWVAKFEASGVLSTLSSKPNLSIITLSQVSNKIGNAFTYIRTMENNNRYGWGTSGNGVDTHMMKNVEWGAVAFLSKSAYGINGEVGINNYNGYRTGCGAAPGTASSSTCNAYDTANGMLASTTGNIYGIYDMNGGANEYVASYVNNGNSILATNGLAIVNANAKYKDVYSIGATDTITNNYNATSGKKGDALYETSSAGDVALKSWYGDYSWMLYSASAWLHRGGYNGDAGSGGLFAYNCGDGAAAGISWRPTLLVGAGL